MRTQLCYIVGAGDYTPIDMSGAFVIAADGGLDALQNDGLRPDLVVGDFDSINRFVPGIPRVVLPTHKDLTDMAAACQVALRLGYKRLVLNGVMGGRADHAVANIQLMARLAQRGIDVSAVSPDMAVWALHNGKVTLGTFPGQVISVFSHGNAAQGVTLEGLGYPLSNARLCNTNALGVSNVAIGNKATIHVRKGTLLIMRLNKGAF